MFNTSWRLERGHARRRIMWSGVGNLGSVHDVVDAFVEEERLSEQLRDRDVFYGT